jgi:tape measure domain-containing protein
VANPKIIITGDSTGAVSAVTRLRNELSATQSIAAKGLSLVGLSVSAAEIIKVADNYGQLAARLQLATRYTGDYAQVQTALNRSATDTRASLTDTVDLYTKLSPALQALGKSGTQSIEIIATVNKAIALSGVSSEAASAGLLQFNQGLASGVLRGEELNSILENTPGLADAIAEGLGKTRGELRALGAEGKLTAEAVITALENVAKRVDDDFKQLPLSVGQAMTLLMNTLTEVVGSGAQATDSMGALARAIVFISDGIKTFSGSVSSVFAPVIEYLIDKVDYTARIFRIAGTAIAGLSAAAVSNYKQTGTILTAMRENINKIIDEPTQSQSKKSAIVADAQQIANKRLDIETKLAEKLKEMAQLRGIQEGKIAADILLADDKKTAAQIKNAEKLRDALLKAWEDSKTGAAAAGQAAKDLFEKAADVRQSGADKAADKTRSTLSPEEQQKDIAAKFADLSASANEASLLAKIASYNGRVENAAKLTAQATKDAERASALADKISDPNAAAAAITQVAEIQAQLLEAQATAKKQEQKTLDERAAAQATMINDLDKQITDLQTKAANIQIAADVTKAQSAISGLQAQLDAMQDKTITVTVVTKAEGGTAPAGDAAAFARGGYTGPGGKWQAAGIVHAGEFVHRQEVVRQPGALAFLARFNREGMAALRRNGYAAGGLVSNLAMPSLNRATPAASSANATFNFPGMGSFQATLAPDVMSELKTAFSREALKKGGRR